MPPAALLESCQAKARGQVSIIFVWHDIYLHSAICCHASLRGSVPYIANCSCSIIILKCVTCTSYILQSHRSLSLSLSLSLSFFFLSLCLSLFISLTLSFSLPLSLSLSLSLSHTHTHSLSVSLCLNYCLVL